MISHTTYDHLLLYATKRKVLLSTKKSIQGLYMLPAKCIRQANIDFFYSVKKMYIRYFNPFRLTDPFRR